jgi:hypothetical protein
MSRNSVGMFQKTVGITALKVGMCPLKVGIQFHCSDSRHFLSKTRGVLLNSGVSDPSLEAKTSSITKKPKKPGVFSAGQQS